MEVDDVSDLIGTRAALDLAGISVLDRPEPVVVRAAGVVDPSAVTAAAAALRQVPTVTVVVGDPSVVPTELAAAADVCLTEVDRPPAPWVHAPVDQVVATVRDQPLASVALVSLLRTTEALDPWSAVAAEAIAYAMLLGSDAHRRWLDARELGPPRPADSSPVRLGRIDAELHVTLDRAASRNAIDRSTRDALIDALDVAVADPTIEQVHLAGEGPDFSAGGDLREFGTTTDPATAFAVRLSRHPGWAVHRVADRLHAHLHGHCIGAGIEIPAFASQVTADADTRIALPELAMGLIPGAGGTASLPRRIGRQRTAWLALTGTTLTATAAQAWGLVDDLSPVEPHFR